MPQFIPIITAVAAGVSAVATVKGMQAQQKATKATIRAQDEQRKQQQLAATRSRRQAVREAQIARARAVSSAAAAGGMGGSGMGGIGSIGAQLGSGLGYASQQGAIGSNIFGFQQQALRFGAQADMWGGIAGIAGQVSSMGVKMGGADWLLPQQSVNQPPKNYVGG